MRFGDQGRVFGDQARDGVGAPFLRCQAGLRGRADMFGPPHSKASKARPERERRLPTTMLSNRYEVGGIVYPAFLR